MARWRKKKGKKQKEEKEREGKEERKYEAGWQSSKGDRHEWKIGGRHEVKAKRGE